MVERWMVIVFDDEGALYGGIAPSQKDAKDFALNLMVKAVTMGYNPDNLCAYLRTLE